MPPPIYDEVRRYLCWSPEEVGRRYDLDLELEVSYLLARNPWLVES